MTTYPMEVCESCRAIINPEKVKWYFDKETNREIAYCKKCYRELFPEAKA